MLRTHRHWPIVALVALASCKSGAKTAAAPAEAPPPLLLFAQQRLVLVPTARVQFSSSDPLIQELGSSAAVGRFFDDELLRSLRERGAANDWILPADLVRAHERNRTYAQDPYRLAVEAIALPTYELGKYGEPLSTQLRTMIALHTDARFVVLPVSLRLHSMGRTRLRLVLVDPRKAESLWIGDVVSDSGAVASRATLTQVARRATDLFAAP